jgi:hypothetical protein
VRLELLALAGDAFYAAAAASWTPLGACQQEDPELFFPPGASGQTVRRSMPPKRCAVAVPCALRSAECRAGPRRPGASLQPGEHSDRGAQRDGAVGRCPAPVPPQASLPERYAGSLITVSDPARERGGRPRPASTLTYWLPFPAHPMRDGSQAVRNRVHQGQARLAAVQEEGVGQ